MAEDFEEAGQRYLFLLRPVKDLSKNFETDISKELDDYCLSLGEVAANEEFGIDNQHRFNFAEAAMLIQGSAFVFGRKVDYLHSQAMHFFETLQPQKTKKTKKIAQEDDDEGFVEENEAAIDPCDLVDYGSLKPCNVESLYRVHAKSKYKGNPPKIKIMPMSLLPLAENEKSGAMIYSVGHRVEVVGNVDDFRMNYGFLNSRGVLLLHLGHEQIVDDFASDAFVRLWQPHLIPPNEKAKPPTLPQEGIVLNLDNQPADSGRGSPEGGIAASDREHASSVVEKSRRVTADTFNDITSTSTHLTEAMGVEKEGVEVPAKGDFGCCDDDFYAGEAHTLPLPPSSRNIRRLKPQVSPWDISESETIESEADRMLLDPFELVHWKVKPVETIKRFTRSTAVAAKKEKEENESATFQKLTMQTIDYIKEHFYMRKKHKITKEDNWQTDALYRFMVAASKKRAEAKRKRGRRKANPLYEGWFSLYRFKI
uniref:CNDH2_N domain-containing protein n=1 Tax=Angiostrongylus cantonensis TaxID=6313 RepID=A0A0K0D7R3_ANGCA